MLLGTFTGDAGPFDGEQGACAGNAAPDAAPDAAGDAGAAADDSAGRPAEGAADDADALAAGAADPAVAPREELAVSVSRLQQSPSGSALKATLAGPLSTEAPDEAALPPLEPPTAPRGFCTASPDRSREMEGESVEMRVFVGLVLRLCAPASSPAAVCARETAPAPPDSLPFARQQRNERNQRFREKGGKRYSGDDRG